MSQPIKVCLIRRAMRPLVFPDAYEQFIIQLENNARLGGSHRQRCRCKPECQVPTYEDAERLTERVTSEPEHIRQEFLKLFRVPETR